MTRCLRDYNVLDCSNCMVEVTKTNKDKISDNKSKDIVIQKIIEVLNSFSVSSSARQLSLHMEALILISSTRLLSWSENTRW